MGKTNYYIILGVDRDEDPAEIRQAFRRLAKACHPDCAGPGKTEEFDRIAKAYEVLSDPEKRAQYNRELERAEGRRPEGNSRSGAAFEAVRGGKYANAFGTGGRFRTKRAQVFEHRPEALEIVLSPDEAARGGALAFTVPVRRLCPKCGGMGVEWPFHCSACEGRGEIHVDQAVEVTIPAGAKSGMILNLSLSRSDPRRQDIRIVLKVA